MMKNYLALALAVLFFVACSNEEVKNDLLFEKYQVNDKITLQSVNGGSKTLVRREKGFVVEGEEDKVLMFDFFGTFCAPCKEEASSLTKLWQNNSQKFILIGLTHFESVSDEAVKAFADEFMAYYFLSNSPENARIIAQILEDIDYKNMEQLPFKVVMKNGVYQSLSDFWNKGQKVSFYLGKVPTSLMQADLNQIYELK